ncbi:MAG: A/G-specific adenine glycosylase [Deltaproteobacteria bacterium]|nr:A/G-specific adenine glycosylase [Deltaproteobacteria bacterium]
MSLPLDDRSRTAAVTKRRHGAGGALIAPALLGWYDRRQRDLPWRREVSAYRTLVSEFMLQQTVVAAAVPFFERFLARFPDLPTLAAASEDQVLALWSGLGYYARARNLHRAARAVVEVHQGQIPADEAALLDLPGIGPYTAAAVAAIAFGRRTFALDGNAARVVARLAAVAEPIDKPATRDRLREVGLGWVPTQRPGDFAQAVMELGATVCVPRTPVCGECPLRTMCAARRQNLTSEIPVKAIRPPKRMVRVASVRLRQGGRVLLVRRKTGLLAGTWMLPAAVMTAGTSPAVAARQVLRELGIVSVRVTPVGSIRHLFTHRDITVDVFDGVSAQARSTGGAPHPTTDQLWVDESRLDEVAVSSFLRKQLALKRDKRSESP